MWSASPIPNSFTTSSLRAPNRETDARAEREARDPDRQPGRLRAQEVEGRAHVVLLADAVRVASRRRAHAAEVEAEGGRRRRPPAPSPRDRRRCCSWCRPRAGAGGTRRPPRRPSSARAGSLRAGRARRGSPPAPTEIGRRRHGDIGVIQTSVTSPSQGRAHGTRPATRRQRPQRRRGSPKIPNAPSPVCPKTPKLPAMLLRPLQPACQRAAAARRPGKPRKIARSGSVRNGRRAGV